MLTASEIREKVDWLKTQKAADMGPAPALRPFIERSAGENQEPMKEAAAEAGLNVARWEGGDVIFRSPSIRSRAADAITVKAVAERSADRSFAPGRDGVTTERSG